MEFFLLVGVFVAPIINQIIIWLPATTSLTCYEFINCKDNMILIAIGEFARSIIISLILFIFYKIFNAIKEGHEFHFAQTHRVYTLGWLVALYAIYSILIETLIVYVGSGAISFNFSSLVFLPIGIGLIILGNVLSLAAELKKEQELII